MANTTFIVADGGLSARPSHLHPVSSGNLRCTNSLVQLHNHSTLKYQICRCSSSSAETKGPAVALKEWAAIVAALAGGDQVVIFRKGGIREPAFRPKEKEFYLFPNSFHSDDTLLKPEAAQRFSKELAFNPKEQLRVRIDCTATITGAWTTHNPDVLDALTAFHVLGPDFLSRRMNWRPQQPMNILELRCQRLRQPLLLPQSDAYYGCFSWLQLPAQLPSEGVAADPALPDDVFQARQAGLRDALAAIDAKAAF